MARQKRGRSRSATRNVKRRMPYRRKFTKRRGMASMIKRVMLKQCETKHKTTSVENANLNHNSAYALPVFTQLSQGTDENQRIGDEVIGKYIKFKFQFFSKLDRPNVTYRIIVYRAPKDEESSYNDIMEGVVGNNILDNVNTEKYTPIMQKYVKIAGNTAIGPSGTIGGYE